MLQFIEKRILPLILVFSCSVFATNYYVSVDGSDDTNDGTLSAPFAGPQKGLDMAMPGDTVYVGAGIYFGNFNFPRDSVALVGEGHDGWRARCKATPEGLLPGWQQ